MAIWKFLKDNTGKEGISELVIENMTSKDPETPVFYILPNIHNKGIVPPPGGPIVASINSPTERVSACVDCYLQDFVKTTESYIKKSDNFTERLQPF